MDAWTFRGGAAFSTEKDQISSKDKKGTPIIVKFESKPDEQTHQILKSLGLKWNSLRSEWEGYGDVVELERLLQSYEVMVNEIGL